MRQGVTVCILVAEYENEKELNRMLEGIITQNIDFKCDIEIIENKHCRVVPEWLMRFNAANPYMKIEIYSERNFKWSDIDYVAFCFYGDYWCDCNKLKKQVAILEVNSQYIGVVHDISIASNEGIPYSFAEQQAYKRFHYSTNRQYSWEQFQLFLLPGAISTLVCQNIFNTDTIGTFIKAVPGNEISRLFAVLAFQGICCNLYDLQMAQCYRQNGTEKKRAYDNISLDGKELEQISQFAMRKYGIELDLHYCLIRLAIEGFENYQMGLKTAGDLKQVASLCESAYDPSWALSNKQTQLITEQRSLYGMLQSKIFSYLIKKGTADEHILIRFIDPYDDEVRVEYILRSYCRWAKINKSVRQYLLDSSKDPKAVKAVCQSRIFTAPMRRTKRKLLNLGRKLHRSVKRIVTLNMRKKGYSAFMANEWFDSVRVNLLSDKSFSLRKKMWCYRRGFMPWRITQYGLTKENYELFLSDRDYMYLHQINNSYKKWIEDKMTMRYVLEPFKEYLPKYYFQIIRREGYTVILPLMDRPEGYEATFDDLFRLLRDKKNLALKAASGTHGVGFYKMSYEDGKYYLNNKEASEFEIKKVILNFKSYYVVTEYIDMHQQIKNMYAGSVNTLRLMVINRDGLNPQILDAYMRIGSVTTGTTDNVAFGGVFCKIDVGTGKYGNAEQSKNHVLVPCPRHPDTDTLIEGTIPHWQLITEQVIAISKYIGQLEYMGFDVVCTPESFVILEINSHQDLHRYIYYDPKIKQFFFDKLKYKKKLYNRRRY